MCEKSRVFLIETADYFSYFIYEMISDYDNLKINGLDWKVFSAGEISSAFSNADDSLLEGCDSSAANLFLLQKRYGILLCKTEKALLRYYSESESYGFPILFKGGSEKDFCDSLGILIKDAESKGHAVKFVFCTQKQKSVLDDCLRIHFSGKHIEWNTDRNDSDYLYEQQKLSVLPGKDFHKKKNHVSRFSRIYDGRFQFKFFSPEDYTEQLKKDVLYVAEKWADENNSEIDDSLRMEEDSLRIAAENVPQLNLTGALLYIDSVPCAVTLAGKISSSVVDIIFEKALSYAADNGAYAAINKFFAGKCQDFTFINREEDMGVEGLRKAKLSYKPFMILDKYYGTLV